MNTKDIIKKIRAHKGGQIRMTVHLRDDTIDVVVTKSAAIEALRHVHDDQAIAFTVAETGDLYVDRPN